MNYDWKNTRDLYVQYCLEISEKEKYLLEKYAWFFDDQYFYWSPKKRPDILKRAPIWMHPRKQMPSEKYKKYNGTQQLLIINIKKSAPMQVSNLNNRNSKVNVERAWDDIFDKY